MFNVVYHRKGYISNDKMELDKFKELAVLATKEDLALNSIFIEVEEKLAKAEEVKKESIIKITSNFNTAIGWEFGRLVEAELNITDFKNLIRYVGENYTLIELEKWVIHHIESIEEVLLDGKIKTSSSIAHNLQKTFEFEANAELRKYYKTIISRIEKVKK